MAGLGAIVFLGMPGPAIRVSSCLCGGAAGDCSGRVCCLPAVGSKPADWRRYSWAARKMLPRSPAVGRCGSKCGATARIGGCKVSAMAPIGPSIATTSLAASSNGIRAHSHSIYMELLIDLGLIGLALCLVVTCLSVAQYSRLVAETGRFEFRLLGALFVCAPGQWLLRSQFRVAALGGHVPRHGRARIDHENGSATQPCGKPG